MFLEEKNKLSMTKIFLASVVLICLGTVLGVVGYLAWNKEAIKKEPLISIKNEEKPYIKIVSPQGGEQWDEGKAYDIKWESQGVKKVGIEVSLNNGYIEKIVYDVDAKVGVFHFNIPIGYLNGLEMADQNVKAKIYIYALDVIDKKDGMTGRLSNWSNDNFIIHTDIKPNAPFIKVVTPNGGEEWKAGNTYEIKWSSNVVGKINIIIDDIGRVNDSSGYFLNIAHDLEAISGKYIWKIPEDIPSSKYKIKIERADTGKRKKYIKSLSSDYFNINGLLSVEEQKKMLKQMFPNNEINGNKVVTSDYSIYLEGINEGPFLKAVLNSYLFVVRVSGVPHAGGLDHAFIGVFDNKKKLVTSPISDPLSWDYNRDFSSGHLGGDIVNLDFRDCGGVKYVLAYVGGCPNGGLCSGSYYLIKVENNNFKSVQYTSRYLKKPSNDGAQMVMKGDNILVYTNKFANDGFICKAPNCLQSQSLGEGKSMVSIYSKKLTWDKNTCRFKN